MSDPEYRASPDIIATERHRDNRTLIIVAGLVILAIIVAWLVYAVSGNQSAAQAASDRANIAAAQVSAQAATAQAAQVASQAAADANAAQANANAAQATANRTASAPPPPDSSQQTAPSAPN